MNENLDKLGNLSGPGLDSGILVFPYYLDLNFGPSSFVLGPSSPDIVQVDPGNTTNIFSYAFDGATITELLFGGAELQHNYKEGSIMIPHLHWMPSTNNAGNVKWFAEYYFKEGANIKLARIDSVVQAASGTAWQGQRVDFPSINIPTLLIGTQLFFSISRDPTDGQDTYPNDAVLGASFGFHYIVNTAGSRQVITKF